MNDNGDPLHPVQPPAGGTLHMPWLEIDDEEPPHKPLSRHPVLITGVIMLLAVIAAGAWFAFYQTGDTIQLVEQGGTIRADKTPYKVRPKNPEGNVARGVGDTRFVVAEGGNVTMRVSRPQQAADTDGSAANDGKPAGDNAAVQLGAYTTKAAADAAWPALKQNFPLLEQSSHRVVEVPADIGSVFALQVLAPGIKEAADLCNELQAEGKHCSVKRY